MVRCINVLIADSNQSLIDDLTKRLEEQEGFHVAGTATDGLQAAELLRTCKPDLLVLDLMLPKLDGVAVLKAANELEKRPAAVVLAAYSSDYVNSILAELGKPGNAVYTEKVGQAYVREFYDPEQHLFTDSAATKHTAAHSNLLPLFFGLDELAPAGTREAIIALLEQKGLTCMGVLLTYHLLAGLKKAGADALVLKLLKSDVAWLRMLREGATTTFEAWGKDEKWNTSLCHPWASSPVLILGDPLL